MLRVGVFAISVFFSERKARAPLPAMAHVDQGVRVGVTENHRNRAAGSGCHVAACSPSLFGIAPEKNAKPMMNPGMKRYISPKT